MWPQSSKESRHTAADLRVCEQKGRKEGPSPRKQWEKSQEAESWEAPEVPRTQLRQCNPTEPLERVKTKIPIQPCKTRAHYRKRKQKQPLGPDSSEERTVFKSYKDL